MDNVLVQRGVWSIQLSYSPSYCSTLKSMSVSNAIPNLQKSLFINWDGLKKGGVKQKQTHITVLSHSGCIPARDRKMEVGRYKGRMLGALPPSYLTWMVKKSYPDAEWSAMALQVLEDPVYTNRMGWEMLSEAMKGYLSSENAESRLNYKSNGGDSKKVQRGSDIKREARIERQRLRRGNTQTQLWLKELESQRRNRFPGRAALIKSINDAESEAAKVQVLLNQETDLL